MQTIQEAKKAWALAQIMKARKAGNNNPVIVMPVFINEGDDENPDWVPTKETAIDGKNPEWCAVAVVSSQRTMINNFVNEQFRSTLLRVKRVNNTFTAGEVLVGKLYVVESTTPTNAGNLEQDRKFISNDAQVNDIPCTIDGEVIYRKVMFTENLSEPDQLLQHDNHDAIVAALAEIKAVANKPMSSAIKGAAAEKKAGVK